MRKLVALLTLVLLLLGILMPVAAQDEGTGYIRVAHFAPAPASVIVFLDGEVALPGLRAGRVSAWREVPAGSYEVRLGTNSGDVSRATVITPVTITVEAGTFTTYAAVGSDNPRTADINEFTITAFDETEKYTIAPAPGTANITFFHAIEGVDPVDVYVVTPAEGVTAAVDGSRLVNALGFPGTFFTPAGPLNDGAFRATVPAGAYDIQVTPNGFRTPVLIDVPGFTVEAGINYLVAAIGTPSSPEVAVVRTPFSDFVTSNIAELAIATPALSTLVAAVQAADPSILETLVGPGPYTVFAPTNDAFAALFEALGVTPADVLANQDLLNTVLAYHVVGAAGGADIHSTELVGRTQVLTLANEFITVSGTTLNGSSNVVIADIPATNGIVHVIDAVLLPPSVVAALAGGE